MEKEKEYLENDSLTIKEIAAYVGYDNEASFKRAFMRYKGITPTKYKNENKNYAT
jgi:AraC-like DNA-binding protein